MTPFFTTRRAFAPFFFFPCALALLLMPVLGDAVHHREAFLTKDLTSGELVDTGTRRASK